MLRDVPAFSIAVGVPARIIKRFDVIRGQWIKADEFTDELELQIPNEAEYLTGLRGQARQPLISRYAAGARSGNLP